jgi:molybdopterin-biosynthesis enzyme MoeA-like protein
MATLPHGTEPIQNPIGTAPGVRVDLGETVLFALPGVPLEMEAIFAKTIAPLFRQAVGDCVFCERSLFADNIVESCLAPLIVEVMRSNAGVYVKSHPKDTGNKSHVELHLTILAKKK